MHIFLEVLTYLIGYSLGLLSVAALGLWVYDRWYN
jgi:hypothetical protein